MSFDLICDTCNFEQVVDEEVRAYAFARDHEAEHGSHFVMIETAQ